MINARRTFRAVAGNQVITTIGRAHCPHRAHRNHVGIVARSRDGPVPLLTDRVVATIVSGGYDDHNTSPPRCLDSLAERVLRVALDNWTSKREIKDANIVGIL